MKRTLSYERTYPHAPEKVWQAVATREALAEWLMPNDFEPEVGHRFQFRTDPAPGFDGIVNCEVLEVEPPHRLRFSWRGDPIDTIVTFTLEPAEAGTRLRFEQSGFEGARAILVSFILGAGWKKMSRTTLPSVLGRIDDAGRLLPAEEAPDTAACRHRGLAGLLARVGQVLPRRTKVPTL